MALKSISDIGRCFCFRSHVLFSAAIKFQKVSQATINLKSGKLNDYFDPAVFNHNFVSLNGVRWIRQTCARAYVEAPAVPVAFDGVAAKRAFGERCAAMWAEVFDGVKLAADVVEREFFVVGERDGCAAPGWQFFDAPDDDLLAGAVRALRVAKFMIERLHCAWDRNKLSDA